VQPIKSSALCSVTSFQLGLVRLTSAICPGCVDRCDGNNDVIGARVCFRHVPWIMCRWHCHSVFIETQTNLLLHKVQVDCWLCTVTFYNKVYKMAP